MHFFRRLTFLFRLHLERMNWFALLTLFAAHLTTTWALLYAAGEAKLIELPDFVYYYVITASTVGYGDLSPVTSNGRWVVALFQVPFGLALFGVMLAKLGQTMATAIRKNMSGERSFWSSKNHIVILGWHSGRTVKVIEQLLADMASHQESILLAVVADMQNPFPETSNLHFAKLSSFTDNSQLRRVAIESATKIIIDASDDNETLAATLAVAAIAKDDCHITTYFDDETKVQLLQQHCPNVEFSSGHAAELLVRSIQDPGSSRVHNELLSSLYGDTLYSLELPTGFPREQTFEDIFLGFKKRFDATVIAVASNHRGAGLDLNPSLIMPITAGLVIYYLAKDRIVISQLIEQY